MKKEKKSLYFLEKNKRYTPIISGVMNEFIELEYDTLCIYWITWVNKFERIITSRVEEEKLCDFIKMLHNKYYYLLTK